MLSEIDDAQLVACLQANLTTFVFDYIARQKAGGINFNFFIVEQLPVLHPSTYDPELMQLIVPRVLELDYTAWDIQPFARDCGYNGPPFAWDEERRACLRAELDGCFAHLYGLNRDDFAYILDTFPIVRRNDEARWGEFRTKRLVLEAYDGMAEAMARGRPYQSPLDPPPADPRVAHSPREMTKSPAARA
jgi:hypothetical protein